VDLDTTTSMEKNAHANELQCVTTASTESFSDNEDISTPRFAPQNDIVATPPNQNALTSYEDLGLTPTKMREMQDVVDEMKKDHDWTQEIQSNNDNVFRLIVFLYGKGYYSKFSPTERVARIKACIEKGNRKRLREIALSSSSDKLLKGDDAFKVYFTFANSVRLFFANDNATGGFPKGIFYRVQASSNCYIVAACMWISLCMQKCNPESELPPLDVGYIGRNYVINTTEGLETRVIGNRGGNAMGLARKIIGDDPEIGKVCLNFSRLLDRDKTRHRWNLDSYMEDGYIGLVSQFVICENFSMPCEKDALEESGYWKFDGNSIDCEGVFVPLTGDDTQVQMEHTNLRQKWRDQQVKIEQSKTRFHAATKLAIDQSTHGTAERDGMAISSPVSKVDDQTPHTTKHAMVMIGSCLEKVNDSEKRLYLLLNWWKKMPLVLVSFEYLVSCQCSVFFCSSHLPAAALKNAIRNETLACECSFPDHGEDTCYEEWWNGIDGNEP
jgi:hypothetical protein